MQYRLKDRSGKWVMLIFGEGIDLKARGTDIREEATILTEQQVINLHILGLTFRVFDENDKECQVVE